MQSYRFTHSLSVIIPVYNDQEVLPELQRRLRAVLDQLAPNTEIIFVDDGSQDGSLRVLLNLQAQDGTIKIVQLTRNFGQPNALDAGLEAAQGEILVLMDSDLQDRPEDIGTLIEAMIKANVPMAVARWSTRQDSRLKVFTSRAFNALANRITNIRQAPRTRVFRVLKRDLLEDLKRLEEKSSTTLSLLYWLGHDFTVVDLVRDPRWAGSSSYTLKKMVKLSLDRIFSYSLLPIRLASLLGVALGFLSILMALYFIIHKLVLQRVVPGWTSLVVIILFLMGMNFIFMGVIGEYLGRIYLETKNRPKYVVKKVFQKNGEKRP
jgi:polyisoprenyl-phosphate glycosyltransferase